jgi:hypothetical protein
MQARSVRQTLPSVERPTTRRKRQLTTAAKAVGGVGGGGGGGTEVGSKVAPMLGALPTSTVLPVDSE